MRQKGISKYKKTICFHVLQIQAQPNSHSFSVIAERRKTQHPDQIIKRANTPVPYSRARPTNMNSNPFSLIIKVLQNILDSTN